MENYFLSIHHPYGGDYWFSIRMQLTVVHFLSEQTITYSKGRREASFHLSVSSSICSSVQSSICFVMVCLLRRGGERVEYRCGTTEKAIGRDDTHAKALQ
jgi:hypothetical protein